MINLCKECDIRPICMMYADFSKHSSHVEIELQKCHFRQWTGEKYNNKNISAMNRAAIDPLTNKSKVDRNKINELSNQNRIKKEKEKDLLKSKTPKPKMSIEAKPLILDYTCAGCNASTFAEDRSNCAKCNTDICSCCATTDGDTGNLLCPKCWAEL